MQTSVGEKGGIKGLGRMRRKAHLVENKIDLMCLLAHLRVQNIGEISVNSSPQCVKQAILAIWITLVISALSALVAKISGLSSQGDFISSIIVYAFCCIFPYKLSNRSNPTRYVYVVLAAISFLFMAAGIGTINKVDFAVSILLIPVEIFIIYKLFQSEASAWFTSK
jgi:hypothetical protein